MEILSEEYIVVGQETLKYPTDVNRFFEVLAKAKTSMIGLSIKMPDTIEVRGQTATEMAQKDIEKIRILFTNVILVDSIIKNEIRIIKKGTNIELSDQMEVLKKKFGEKLRNVIVEKTIKPKLIEKESESFFADIGNQLEGADIKEINIKLYKEPLPNLIYVINIIDARKERKNYK